jgi:hypothetical protein
MTSPEVIEAGPILWFASLAMGLVCRTINVAGRWLVRIISS